jgi:hypothetical protein
MPQLKSGQHLQMMKEEHRMTKPTFQSPKIQRNLPVKAAIGSCECRCDAMSGGGAGASKPRQALKQALRKA